VRSLISDIYHHTNYGIDFIVMYEYLS